jgi:hypothetical protein
MNGYISNLRIVKGTALYTEDFDDNLPTEPLTSISGTSLLTCQSPTVIDNSDNDFAITVNGNSQPSKFNPFGETVTTGVEYTPAAHGGSWYFPYTTNDQLNLNGESDFAFGTGDFSVEMWYYVSNPGVAHILYEGRASGEQTNGVLSLDATTLAPRYNASSTTQILGTGPNAYCWNHFLLTRKSGSTRIFVNGTQSGSTYADSTNYTTSAGRPIFGNHGFNSTKYPAHGYFSDIKIQKGFGIGSAFSPPAVRNTALLENPNLWISATNAAIYDATGRNVLETVGNARVVNGVKKYGTGSIYFDGTGDALVMPRTSELTLGSSDFTLECWIYTAGGVAQNIYSSRTGSTRNGWLFGVNASNYLYIVADENGSSPWAIENSASNSGSQIPLNEWVHIALAREGSSWRTFINGTLNYTVTSSISIYEVDASVTVGADQKGANAPINGFIDDLRITKGVARYTANFTPPSSFKLK